MILRARASDIIRALDPMLGVIDADDPLLFESDGHSIRTSALDANHVRAIYLRVDLDGYEGATLEGDEKALLTIGDLTSALRRFGREKVEMTYRDGRLTISTDEMQVGVPLSEEEPYPAGTYKAPCGATAILPADLFRRMVGIRDDIGLVRAVVVEVSDDAISLVSKDDPDRSVSCKATTFRSGRTCIQYKGVLQQVIRHIPRTDVVGVAVGDGTPLRIDYSLGPAVYSTIIAQLTEDCRWTPTVPKR